MDFSFTPEQMMFKEAVGHFAKKELELLVKQSGDNWVYSSGRRKSRSTG